MTPEEILRAIARVPEVELPPIPDALLAASAAYLASNAAASSVEADAYWPKWDSPWWHMLLLLELDEARRIPARIVDAVVARLNAMPVHIFPIHPGEMPPGIDHSRDTLCHCALGSISQVLAACGVDIERALPWAEPWYERYQMADGGANCDEKAYLVNECASSMVATIAPLEAMLSRPSSAYTDRAAAFLIGRRLTHGSPSQHNAEERSAAPDWLRICFPRFYFYDVLRGLCALTAWATAYQRTLPLEAIAGAVSHLADAFPDGIVRVQRRAFASTGSLVRTGSAWRREPSASSFALLEATSVVGEGSAVLTRRWATARRQLRALLEAGAISA